MSDDYQRVEIITGTPRRRRWTAEQKLRIVEESHLSGESISAVARRRGVAANLLYRWRRLTAEGGVAALSADASHSTFSVLVQPKRRSDAKKTELITLTLPQKGWPVWRLRRRCTMGVLDHRALAR